MKGFLGAFLVFTLWAVGSIYYLHLKKDTATAVTDNNTLESPLKIDKSNNTQTNQKTIDKANAIEFAAKDTLITTLEASSLETKTSNLDSIIPVNETNSSPAAITDAQLLADEMKKSIAISDTIDIDINEPEQTLETKLYVADGPSVSSRIFYPEYNQSDLVLDKALVDYAGEIKRVLKQHPDKKVTIIGHTDNIGNSEDNFRIALRKARQVKWYLTARRGIARKYVTATSRGEEEPIENNNSAWGRKKNNRIEIIID